MLGQKNCGKEGYEIKAMNWNSKIRDWNERILLKLRNQIIWMVSKNSNFDLNMRKSKLWNRTTKYFSPSL